MDEQDLIGYHDPVGGLSVTYLLSSLLICGMWPQLWQLHPAWGFAFLGLVFGASTFNEPGASVPPKKSKKNKSDREISPEDSRRFWPTDFSWLPAIIGGLLASAPLLLVLLSLNQEFPLRGDHDHHIFTSWQTAQLWRQALWWGFIPASAWIAIWVAKKPTVWAIGPAVGLLVAAAWVKADFSPLARYPAGMYSLVTPWHWLLSTDTNSLALAVNRIINAISPLVWLFVLRPLIIRKWPEWGVLPVIAFLFWQKDIAYYFSTVYLEAWAVIFILLALESVWRRPEPELACYLAGFACMFKEQAIFALMLVWAIGFLRPKARLDWRAVYVGAVSVFPFALYYFFRKQSNVWRKVELTPIAELFGAERLELFGRNTVDHLGWTGILAAVLIVGAMIVSLVRKGPYRRLMIYSALAFLALEYMYFADKVSSEYLGYPRFHITSYPILLLGIWIWLSERPQKVKVALTVLIAALHAPGLLKFVQLHAGPDYERNHIEFFSSPIHIPLRATVRLAQEAGWLQKGQVVLVNDPIGTYNLRTGMMAGYRDLTRNYKIGIPENSYASPVCQCEAGRAVVALKIMGLTRPMANSDSPEVRAQRFSNCVENLRKACGKFAEIKDSTGAPIAAIAK